MAKNLTKAQQRQLELKKEEQALNAQLLADAQEFVSLGGELTALQQEHISNLQAETALRSEGASLESELTTAMQSGNSELEKKAELGQAALDSIRQSLKDGEITADQFRDQAAIIGDIVSGQMDSAQIQDVLKNKTLGLSSAMTSFLESQEKAADNSEMMSSAFSQADDLIGGFGSQIMNYITNPLSAVFALLTASSNITDEIGAKFGAIGVTKFRGELGAARMEFVGMGLEAGEALNVVDSLTANFGIALDKAIDIATTVGDVAKSTGLSTDEASNLVGIFTATQGLTAQEAENLAKSTYELAAANNVAPTQVLKDVAASAETFAIFAGEAPEGLMRAAVQARKLGTNLDAVARSMEGMLDFESSLNAEMTASVMLGRRLNLTKLRTLAYEGEAEAYAKELARLAGTQDDFNKMNIFKKKALARALGVEVGELVKIVNKEKEAATLAGEISKADASNILPQDSMSAIAETISSLKMMGLELVEAYGPQIEELFARLGESILPIAQGAIDFMTSFAEGESVLPNLKAGLIAISAIMAGLAIAATVAAVANIVASFSQIPFGVGVVLGIAAAVGFLAMLGGIAGMFMLETGTELGGVKSDNAIAALHKGETVLNAKDTAMLAMSLNAVRGGGAAAIGTNRQNYELKEEMKMLREEMKGYFGLGGTAIRGIGSKVGDTVRGSIG